MSIPITLRGRDQVNYADVLRELIRRGLVVDLPAMMPALMLTEGALVHSAIAVCAVNLANLPTRQVAPFGSIPLCQCFLQHLGSPGSGYSGPTISSLLQDAITLTNLQRPADPAESNVQRLVVASNAVSGLRNNWVDAELAQWRDDVLATLTRRRDVLRRKVTGARMPVRRFAAEAAVSYMYLTQPDPFRELSPSHTVGGATFAITSTWRYHPGSACGRRVARAAARAAEATCPLANPATTRTRRPDGFDETVESYIDRLEDLFRRIIDRDPRTRRLVITRVRMSADRYNDAVSYLEGCRLLPEEDVFVIDAAIPVGALPSWDEHVLLDPSDTDEVLKIGLGLYMRQPPGEALTLAYALEMARHLA